MLNLYKISERTESKVEGLAPGEKKSIYYHNIFDYPLSFSDLIRWKASDKLGSQDKVLKISNSNGFYFVEGRSGLVYKRHLRKRISAKKINIAKKVSGILSYIPSIKMIAVTGSLAMENSAEDGDIDLMIVTNQGSLWTTRAFAYLLISLFGIKKRSPLDSSQKDKLCMNIWMDESDLVWKKRDRNLYTAHEIAQIVPLVNKDNTYENFLFKNKWILQYWPNSVKIRNPKSETLNKFPNLNLKYFKIVLDLMLRASNLLAFKLQYQHMKSKITRETITKTRALFHPVDWGKVVLQRLTP